MAELPSGTVTFLFTDVEGSTRLLDELGERYAEVLAEHRRALRDSFARHGGVEVDTQGDAFFVAFAKASDALAAAAAAQDALADGPIRVRIGIHTGSLAAIRACESALETAAILVGASEACVGETAPAAPSRATAARDRALSLARDQLGPEAAEAAVIKGRKLPIDEALGLVLTASLD